MVACPLIVIADSMLPPITYYNLERNIGAVVCRSSHAHYCSTGIHNFAPFCSFVRRTGETKAQACAIENFTNYEPENPENPRSAHFLPYE
jgi:hypothetical protein